MDVTLYNVVLFLHIGIVIVSFAIAGVLHAALHSLPRARTVGEMRLFARLIHTLEPLLPIFALVILLLGAWLVHLGHWAWGTGWIDTGITALVIIEGLAGSLLAPRTKQLVADIEAAGEGPVTDELRAASLNPVIWDVAHIATLGFLGVVFVMAVKPVGWFAAIIVIAAAVIGVGLSRFQLNAAQGSYRLLPSSGAAGGS
jgi:hypothetical protein